MKRAAAILTTLTLLLFPPAILAAEEIVVNAVGDIMLAGRWTATLRKKGYDFPFGGTITELARGDINLANLESPLARGGSEFFGKKFRFRGEPQVAQAMARAGFNLVTLANNHSMDFGAQALAETMLNLEAAGIAWVGAGKNLTEARQMALFTIRGRKIAFLGYSLTQPPEFFARAAQPGTAPGREKLYLADIARARRAADYVVVSFHWGKEGSGTVQAYQRMAARKAIDAGADAVIGHHPHVLQGVERYGNGIIFYSLGNFAFASTSRTAEYAALVRLRLNGPTRQAEIFPLDVLYSRVHFQPRILSGRRAENVIASLNSLSKPLRTEIRTSGGRHTIDF
jgi:poly-gamma-glutamate synthesis protein (capsule biosynthesis protein)